MDEAASWKDWKDRGGHFTDDERGSDPAGPALAWSVLWQRTPASCCSWRFKGKEVWGWGGWEMQLKLQRFKEPEGPPG